MTEEYAGPEAKEIRQALEKIGFSHEWTGGNCTAFEYNVGDVEVLITLEDEALSPVAWDDVVEVGIYSIEEGVQLGFLRGLTMRQLLADTKDKIGHYPLSTFMGDYGI